MLAHVAQQEHVRGKHALRVGSTYTLARSALVAAGQARAQRVLLLCQCTYQTLVGLEQFVDGFGAFLAASSALEPCPVAPPKIRAQKAIAFSGDRVIHVGAFLGAIKMFGCWLHFFRYTFFFRS